MENAKLLAFEYIINRLIAWYIEIKQTDTETALKNFNKLITLFRCCSKF